MGKNKFARLYLIALVCILLMVSLPVTSALTISRNPNPVREVGEDSAVIEWNTNEPAISSVQYGLNKNDINQIQQNNSRNTFHKITLKNLLPKTKYYYAIVSAGESGSKIDDNGGRLFYFTTDRSADQSPPIISNITAQDFTKKSTTITWNTNEPSTSIVSYGINNFDDEKSSTGLTTRHSINLPTVEGEIYQYKIESCDSKKNCAKEEGDGFLAGRQKSFRINLELGNFATEKRITIPGFTNSFATVKLKVNGKVMPQVKADLKGNFKFKNIFLPDEENTLFFEAFDQTGQSAPPLTKTIKVDTITPKVVFEDIPAVVGESLFKLNGESSELVTLEYSIQLKDDEIPPSRVSNLKLKELKDDSIEIIWAKNPEDDLLEYAVYKTKGLEKTLLAIVSANENEEAKFIDTNIDSNTEYSYRISAIDKSCNEGAFSSTLKVTSKDGNIAKEKDQPKSGDIKFSCISETQSKQVQSQFTIDLALQPGKNFISLKAFDSAGNTVKKKYETFVDTSTPEILETNIDSLSPSYSELVKIRGRISKQASVLIFLNNETKKPYRSVLTDANGNFEANIKLQRSIKLAIVGGESVVADVSQGWENKIRIRAVDAVGRQVEIEEKIDYLLCGTGGKFTVTIDKPLPERLTPRLLLDGLQQVGFPINVSYRGTRKARITRINVDTLTLSKSMEEEYDHDWITINPIFRRGIGKPSTEGYVQLNFNAQDLLPGDGVTLADKEAALSDHREGECAGIGGCVKLLLQVQVEAQEDVDLFQPGPSDRLANSAQRQDIKTNRIIQKTCVDVNLMIDESIHLSEYLPSKLMQTVSEVLDEVIETFDSVLEPLTTIGTYALYSCLAMQGVLFLTKIKEGWSCQFSGVLQNPSIGSVLSAVAGNSEMEEIAEAGLCEYVYGSGAESEDTKLATDVINTVGSGTGGATGQITGQDKQAAYEQCMTCQEAKDWSVWYQETIMRPVCDRVACPSAPTLQTYINSQKQPKEIKDLKKFSGPGAQLQSQGQDAVEPSNIPNNVDGKLYVGNDCGFKAKVQSDRNRDGKVVSKSTGDYLNTFYSTREIAGKLVKQKISGEDGYASNSKRGIKEIYIDYLAHRDDEGEAFERGVRAGKSVSGVSGSALSSGASVTSGSTSASASPSSTTSNSGANEFDGNTIDCGGLHPANPACCGTTYMREWEGACGIPSLGLEFFNEIEESSCLAAQNANQKKNFEEVLEPGFFGKGQCDSLFNSAAGMCEPDTGGPNQDLISTNIAYDIEQLGLSEQTVYIFLTPEYEEGNSDNEYQQYAVEIGGIAKTYEFERTTGVQEEDSKGSRKGRDGLKRSTYLTNNLRSVIGVSGNTDVTNLFSEQNQTAFRENRPESKKVIEEFKNKICEESRRGSSLSVTQIDAAAKKGKEVQDIFNVATEKLTANVAGYITSPITGYSVTGDASNTQCALNDGQARSLYEEVINRVGHVDKEFIVRPAQDGILRSIQCVCLPALTGYVKLWKNILVTVNNCIKSIAMTGDASGGVCQAVLSRYACDMLYDAISCFTQKTSFGGSDRPDTGFSGIGDFVGALTNAGTETSRSVEGRYGETALWKSMFNERKLLHSACMFAFTGTWDLDAEGLFEQTVDETIVDTQALIFPAERRFISYDPTTSPRGLTTWNYHFGAWLNPGMKLNYWMELQCSDDLSCESRDGFVNNKCDCFGKGKKTLPMSSPDLGDGNLDKFELFDKEIFFTTQAGGEGSNLRYDKVVLHWEGTDDSNRPVTGQVEQKIHLTGGPAPGFCSFDAFALSYRCQFGGGDYSGARFSLEPEPIYPEGQDAFILKDPLKFNMRVLTNFPNDNENCLNYCSYYKLLTYTIKNNQGKVIKNNTNPNDPGLITVDTDGERTYTLPKEIFELNSDHFEGGGRQDARQITDNLVAPGSESEFFKRGFFDNTPPANAKINFIIHIYEDNKFKVYSPNSVNKILTGSLAGDGSTGIGGAGIQPSQRTKNGYFEKLDNDKIAEGTITNDKIIFDYDKNGFSSRVTFNVNSDISKNTEIRIKHTQTRSQGTCDRYKTSPAEFIAEFTIYDLKKKQFGGFEPDFNSITLDPVSEDEQKVQVKFKAYCNDKYKGSTEDGTIKECSATRNNLACFCGTKAELKTAKDKIGTSEENTINNCGTQITTATEKTGKGYCGYVWDNSVTVQNLKDGNVPRTCQSTASSNFNIYLDTKKINDGDKIQHSNSFTISANPKDEVELLAVYLDGEKLTIANNEVTWSNVVEKEHKIIMVAKNKDNQDLVNVKILEFEIKGEPLTKLDEKFGKVFNNFLSGQFNDPDTYFGVAIDAAKISPSLKFDSVEQFNSALNKQLNIIAKTNPENSNKLGYLISYFVNQLFEDTDLTEISLTIDSKYAFEGLGTHLVQNKTLKINDEKINGT